MGLVEANRMAAHSIIPGGPLDLLAKLTHAVALRDMARTELARRLRQHEVDDAYRAWEAHRLRSGYEWPAEQLNLEQDGGMTR